jgi:hypothetical protein
MITTSLPSTKRLRAVGASAMTNWRTDPLSSIIVARKRRIPACQAAIISSCISLRPMPRAAKHRRVAHIAGYRHDPFVDLGDHHLVAALLEVEQPIERRVVNTRTTP